MQKFGESSTLEEKYQNKKKHLSKEKTKFEKEQMFNPAEAQGQKFPYYRIIWRILVSFTRGKSSRWYLKPHFKVNRIGGYW